jgi:hypothetical protein
LHRPDGELVYIKLDQIVFVMSAKDTGAAERACSMVQLLNGHSDVRESVEEVMHIIENDGLLAKDDTCYETQPGCPLSSHDVGPLCPSGPSLNTLTLRGMDQASIVKPDIFIVDDVALPPPIAFLVLPGEKAVAAKLAGGGLGLASGDAI